MSAFCVFGMTEPVAKKMAQRQCEAMLRKLSEDERKAFGPTDENAWVAEKAADILKAGKSIQISPPSTLRNSAWNG